MNARPGWTPQKQAFYDLANEVEDEPIDQVGLEQAARNELDRLGRELAKGNADPCDIRAFWLDIATYANEGAELARIQAMD